MLTNEQKEQIDKMDDNDKWKLAKFTNNVEILEYLSNEKYWNVRGRVATNVNTPVNILKKLSNDKDSNVRYWVAHNEHVPRGTLTKLSKDENWHVCNWALKSLEKYNIDIDKHTIRGILE